MYNQVGQICAQCEGQGDQSLEICVSYCLRN